MNRRRLLASLVGLGGASLGGGLATLTVGTERAAASARRRAPSEVRMGTTPTPATVTDRTGTDLTLSLHLSAPPTGGRLISERREASTDTLLERVEGRPVESGFGTAILEFDRAAETDRWY
jgi:hypothetical protein